MHYTIYTNTRGDTYHRNQSYNSSMYLISLLFVVNKLRCNIPARKGALTYVVITYMYSRVIHQCTHSSNVALSYTCTPRKCKSVVNTVYS